MVLNNSSTGSNNSNGKSSNNNKQANKPHPQTQNMFFTV